MIKTWNNLGELFCELNETCEYIVIRNYEGILKNSFDDSHNDIDFLCRDIDKFITISGAKQMKYNDKIHCVINVSGTNIRIDIRSVGDNYYDEKWENEMLTSRILYDELLYTMSPENYYYAILYHEIYHKNELKDDYVTTLIKLSEKLGIEFCKKTIKEDLDRYMKIKGYIETGYRSK
ncbi:hypothetical protein [Pseudobutyrivibrio xylanivorans]|uniref:Uncharacterized protein n=1 Tax=Pseudobutyrivibrio xylanivorans TaxID=185007 RepID=A0A1G5RPN4_PSEXY|nr:hypothetical protein [Pseudobutyrivibrio xylanivorans]SCZ76072.1 hypothetical protein SAMN02910350_00064 [Pseudobutyrivibrio xylanivorans]